MRCLGVQSGSAVFSLPCPSPEGLCMNGQNRVFNVSVLKLNGMSYEIRTKAFLYLSPGDPNSVGLHWEYVLHGSLLCSVCALRSRQS